MTRSDMIVALRGFPLKPADEKEWEKKLEGLPILPASMRFTREPNKYRGSLSLFGGEIVPDSPVLINTVMRMMGPIRFLEEYLRRISPIYSCFWMFAPFLPERDVKKTLSRMHDILEVYKAKRNMKIFILESRQAQKLPEDMLHLISSFL